MALDFERITPGVSTWAVSDLAGNRIGTVSGARELGWEWQDRHGCHDVHNRGHDSKSEAAAELLAHAERHHREDR